MTSQRKHTENKGESAAGERIHFVTGRLAEFALRRELEQLAGEVGFQFTIDVLPITVAALMSPAWIAKHLSVPAGTDKIVLPGYCDGDLSPVSKQTDCEILVGPRDLRKLDRLFGIHRGPDDAYGEYDIEIIAEINHAPRLSMSDILQSARQLVADGANRIDVGCEPGDPWSGVGDCVRMLVDEGITVSIDSLNPVEIAAATDSGASLVLSVNATNRDHAVDWGCEVVVIPDDFASLGGLEQTIELLAADQVPMRIDPILEPIGFDFARSLRRYMEVRDRYPDAEMMMGIGNLTELTDVDSAGINVLLLAICQELGIRSVLTTQVINWARSSVRECDLARRLVHYSINHRVPPKHLAADLVTLRDPEVTVFGEQNLRQLAEQIRDNNYRIFAEDGQLHLLGSGQRWQDADPFLLFDKLMESKPKNVDASHAFYLGYEMCKAMIALQLGKEYRQDQALNWGHLTVDEGDRHRLRKRRKRDE